MSKEKIVEESLSPEDKIQKSYTGDLDGVSGSISMSKQKLLFISEKGLFSKSYNLVLDLPYEKIKSLRTKGKSNLIIADVEGLTHTFDSRELSISIVDKALREIREQAQG
jgi:hypothetical protein